MKNDIYCPFCGRFCPEDYNGNAYCAEHGLTRGQDKLFKPKRRDYIR